MGDRVNQRTETLERELRRLDRELNQGDLEAMRVATKERTRETMSNESESGGAPE
jgi:hypothetical protein